ncbi:MAG: hemolysin III family protein [Fibrobacterota bacterium]
MALRSAKSTRLLELEEQANALTHAVGAGICIAGLSLMAVLSAATRAPWKIVSSIIFGATLVLLYSASTLYHSTRSPRLRRAFRVLDHVSIHLLIAGTYTPFLLVNLRSGIGWTLFVVIWGLALAGITKDLFLTGRFKIVSTLLYVLMGWVIVVALPQLLQNLSGTGVTLLFSGGVAYTLGATFYLLDKRMPLGHAAWHLCVLGGSVCHILSVIAGVLPR